MDAFSVLAELGGVELTADQMAQVRAINARYYADVYRLRQSAAEGPGNGSGVAERQASEALHAGVRADVLALLTPAQRQALGGD